MTSVGAASGFHGPPAAGGFGLSRFNYDLEQYKINQLIRQNPSQKERGEGPGALGNVPKVAAASVGHNPLMVDQTIGGAWTKSDTVSYKSSRTSSSGSSVSSAPLLYSRENRTRGVTKANGLDPHYQVNETDPGHSDAEDIDHVTHPGVAQSHRGPAWKNTIEDTVDSSPFKAPSRETHSASLLQAQAHQAYQALKARLQPRKQNPSAKQSGANFFGHRALQGLLGILQSSFIAKIDAGRVAADDVAAKTSAASSTSLEMRGIIPRSYMSGILVAYSGMRYPAALFRQRLSSLASPRMAAAQRAYTGHPVSFSLFT